jgi:hypothetical protein
MTLIKALGLAAVAALAAMAFIGTSSAFAEDEVVLCKKLIEKGLLCPNGSLWPTGSVALALAQGPEFLSSAFNVKCEDSLFEANTGGIAPKLPFEITRLAFGVLPKPELGAGCTGCKEIHVAVGPGLIEVSEFDDFWLKTGAQFKFLGCAGFGLNCEYVVNEFKALIDHNGKHPLHSGENLPRIILQVTLTRVGSGLCPEKMVWDGTYVIYLVHWEKETGLGWPALDLK